MGVMLVGSLISFDWFVFLLPRFLPNKYGVQRSERITRKTNGYSALLHHQFLSIIVKKYYIFLLPKFSPNKFGSVAFSVLYTLGL